ncbi:hypothetical protein FEM48_Zijuj10G0083900 [Ziziphus jujuba var. spinosa]|uniref:Dof-type domain-containing protein n=1 Tax=Ziziphus jujuba var. spinosa TaxID=714518 RepID=A0A978UMB0_ZIZJJ|nr:hypothetical protein FEM48_Zijuj10G0083900 [Ziziphus jujuba var. spinosa]
MSESRDPAIKLFGKTIALPLNQQQEVSPDDDTSGIACAIYSDSGFVAVETCSDDDHKLLSSPTTTSREDYTANEGDGQDGDGNKVCVKETSVKELNSDRDDTSDQIAEDSKDPTTSSGISDNPKTPSVERETSSLKTSKNEEQSNTSSPQEKTLKKPDKILPCPRCNSMETKFCYYNNYNVNQPRHFCKNCQRYWTAGGTMRNVPVGAGRRKNKNSSSSHYHHIVMSDALQTARANTANGVQHSSLGSNGTVLTFGSDSPLCESMASVLNLADKTQKYARNGLHRHEQRVMVSSGGGESADDHSSGSSITASNSLERGAKPAIKEHQALPPQVPCFPGPPWPYPWNSTQWTSPVPPPAFCHSGFPVSFYPAPPYWGCTVPGSWNMPCLSSPSSTLGYPLLSSGPNSSTLGKHSRDGNILNPASSQKEEPVKENNNSEISVLIPKTLRIDDPSEAAKSSIWATLGIKNEKLNSVNGGGLFKVFQSKGDDKNHVVETSPVLQANPAALSRSVSFHERT